MKLILLFCVIFSVSKTVMTIETTREIEGYPQGYLTDCPGVTKEVRISKRSLRQLYFVHLEKGTFYNAKHSRHNYFQMKELASKMDFRNKTVLFMNGYLDSSYLSPVSPIMGSLYTRRGYNVLLLEYLHFTAMSYPRAARVLYAVGRRTAEMLSKLSEHGLDPKKLEIIGISHGGQGISFIAKNYRRITGKNITRVTALDPAGPCFRRLGPEDRIDASDADRVDIIHTNIEGYGIAGAVGHVNFYVNGGEFQTADLQELPCTSACSHSRSYLLWLASLENPDSFIALKCDTIQDARDRNCFDRPLVTNVMGLKTDFKVPGIFYLATRNAFPYYLGRKGIERNNDVKKSYIEELNKEDVLVI